MLKVVIMRNEMNKSALLERPALLAGNRCGKNDTFYEVIFINLDYKCACQAIVGPPKNCLDSNNPSLKIE